MKRSIPEDCIKSCANITQCEHGCVGYQAKAPVELGPVVVQAFVLLARAAALETAVADELERQGKGC